MTESPVATTQIQDDQIEELWLWMVYDDAEGEQMALDPTPGRERPLVGVSRDQAETLRELADRAAGGRELRFVGFRRIDDL